MLPEPSNGSAESRNLGFGTPHGHDGLVELLSTIDDVEVMLCFSSDYPHWSMDDVGYVARSLPKSWHRRLFYENACEVFGWPLPEARQEPALVAGR